ncbi:hypothetical protein ACW5F0_07275 [Luteimonas sp. A534]
MAALALLSCAFTAQAEVLQGGLELRWGDPFAPGGDEGLAPRFQATLVLDSGERITLDPEQARRGAGDLYALANRRVAIEFSRPAAAHGRRVIEAIVPADGIGAPRAEHPIAGRSDTVAQAVLGSTRWITIACKFSDITAEQKTVDFFRAQYGDAVGQLGHYWREVSYNKINLAGSGARGWYTLPNPRSHYVTFNAEEDKDKADLDALFNDCTAAADADVDFRQVLGINLMFNGDLDGYAWGGGRCVTLDGVYNCWSTTWNPPWSFNNVAPLAHEMGHGYGLPHSDNSDGDDDPYDNPWDVMSSAWHNAVQDATYGTRPKHINIYQRDRLGWVDAARKHTIAAGALPAQVRVDYASLHASGNAQMLVLQTPASPDPYRGTIYTVEARRPLGAYEGQLAGDAIIIHSVGSDYRAMAKSQDADVPPANVSNNEGSMFKVGETWLSPDGLFSVHVESKTASGFVVVAGTPVRTGGNQRPAAVP